MRVLLDELPVVPPRDGGREPLLRILHRPAAILVKGYARRAEGVEFFLEAETPGTERWKVLASECPDFGLVEGPVRTACVLRGHA